MLFTFNAKHPLVTSNMYKSLVKSPYKHFRKQRVCQGDIFQDLLITIGSGSDTLHIEANLKYAVVLSQDCDLQQDYDQRNKKTVLADKHVDTILICPAYSLEDFAQGKHVEGRQMETFNGKQLPKLRGNDTMKRYHYLSEDIDSGVPELVLDFKHFLSAPRSILYAQRKSKYVTTINEIYREALSLRFANYLSRIGLPDESSS